MTRTRPFTLIAAILFAITALLHLYRLFTHFQVVAGSHEIPQWASYRRDRGRRHSGNWALPREPWLGRVP